MPVNVASAMTAKLIRVGLTEAHGMAVEQSQHPPSGVRYSFLRPLTNEHALLKSPIKGFMRSYASAEHDLIEAVLSPVLTSRPWIYSCETFEVPVAFTLVGMPIPRSLRVGFVRRLLLQPNCKKLIFWSDAGLASLTKYAALLDSDPLRRKTTVIYPAVRRVSDEYLRTRSETRTLLFSGDFFRKGGVNVVDAFIQLRQRYPHLRLLVCCDKDSDFNTTDDALRREYLHKVRNVAGVEWLGRRPRAELLEHILPQTDVYLLPTYVETFGMALLEAMAYGIPVISTNHFAIPEIVLDGATGMLIDTRRFDCDVLFKGYVVRQLPAPFRDHVTTELIRLITLLVERPQYGAELGLAGLSRARGMFSFDERNRKMLAIYRESIETGAPSSRPGDG